VGRDRQQTPVTMSPILEVAQTLLAASADRGSTEEERAAAAAWLTPGAMSNEQQCSRSFDGAESNERQEPATRDQVDAAVDCTHGFASARTPFVGCSSLRFSAMI
jgi:hypothetical protein